MELVQPIHVLPYILQTRIVLLVKPIPIAVGVPILSQEEHALMVPLVRQDVTRAMVNGTSNLLALLPKRALLPDSLLLISGKQKPKTTCQPSIYS